MGAAKRLTGVSWKSSVVCSGKRSEKAVEESEWKRVV
jgi:hypothetical protein